MTGRKILMTGSSGLVGQHAACVLRAGGGDTRWNLERLRCATRRFEHRGFDIRDRDRNFAAIPAERIAAIDHTITDRAERVGVIGIRALQQKRELC